MYSFLFDNTFYCDRTAARWIGSFLFLGSIYIIVSTFAVCRLNKNFQKRIYGKALQRIIAGTGHIITGPGGLTTAATLAPKAKGPKARL